MNNNLVVTIQFFIGFFWSRDSQIIILDACTALIIIYNGTILITFRISGLKEASFLKIFSFLLFAPYISCYRVYRANDTRYFCSFYFVFDIRVIFS